MTTDTPDRAILDRLPGKPTNAQLIPQPNGSMVARWYDADAKRFGEVPILSRATVEKIIDAMVAGYTEALKGARVTPMDVLAGMARMHMVMKEHGLTTPEASE